MTTAYIPSAKDANTMKHSTTCDTCGKTVTSISAGRLRPAMRRHLLDEYQSLENHGLLCDACEMDVPLEQVIGDEDETI